MARGRCNNLVNCGLPVRVVQTPHVPAQKVYIVTHLELADAQWKKSGSNSMQHATQEN
jgi:hypothetical protein